MVRPTSFRLPEDLLDRLYAKSVESGGSVSALVAGLLDEGLRTRRFPGIVFRDGPAGRRAALADGPDVWEVIRALPGTRGRGDKKVSQLAAQAGLSDRQVRLAVDYYTAFPDEVDARIAADAKAAEHLRDQIGRRERLMSATPERRTG